MKSTDEARRLAAAQFTSLYHHWLRGHGRWPYTINLGKPAAGAKHGTIGELSQWIDDWQQWTAPGTVEWAPRRTPVGLVECPVKVAFAAPAEVATVTDQTRQIWRDATAFLDLAEQTWPGSRTKVARLAPAVLALAPEDRECLLRVADWFLANPASNLFLRQVPIEGIGTKWIGSHRRLLTRLLSALMNDDLNTQHQDAVADDDSGEEEADTVDVASELDNAPEDDGPERSHLLERLGLRRTPTLINTVLCDSYLRDQFGGVRTAAFTAADLSRLTRPPTVVLITENKETGYAVPDRPGLLVLHGLGFNVNPIADIAWIDRARLIYWGDLDAPGFEWLNNLRDLSLQVESLMMDSATIHEFCHLAIQGANPSGRPLPYLTDAERGCYLDIVAGHHGQAFLLEQERLPWPWCLSHIDAALLAAPLGGAT